MRPAPIPAPESWLGGSEHEWLQDVMTGSSRCIVFHLVVVWHQCALQCVSSAVFSYLSVVVEDRTVSLFCWWRWEHFSCICLRRSYCFRVLVMDQRNSIWATCTYMGTEQYCYYYTIWQVWKWHASVTQEVGAVRDKCENHMQVWHNCRERQVWQQNQHMSDVTNTTCCWHPHLHSYVVYHACTCTCQTTDSCTKYCPEVLSVQYLDMQAAPRRACTLLAASYLAWCP
jgi:hypothetical protein